MLVIAVTSGPLIPGVAGIYQLMQGLAPVDNQPIALK